MDGTYHQTLARLANYIETEMAGIIPEMFANSDLDFAADLTDKTRSYIMFLRGKQWTCNMFGVGKWVDRETYQESEE